MASNKARANTGPKNILGRELTIYQAIEAHAQLAEALAGTDELELDLSQIEEVDSAGMQVLIHLHELAARQRKTVRMIHHSPAVLEVLGLFNLEAYFGDPLVLPADAAATV